MLLALLLLALPGSARAQAALSGQVKFSDGTVAAGISVQASSTTSGASQSAYADASGNYVLYLAPDSYNISVQFSSPSFYGYQTLVYSQSVSSSTQLNLTVSDLILSGRILNSGGQPVANAQLNGYGYSSNGSGSLYATSGSDGRFQVRILQGTYSSLQIIPPSGSTYATTSVPSETFTVSTSKDFTLANPISVSGQVKFTDGTVAAGISVQASSTTSGASQSAYADASGNYVLYLAPDSYNISVQFSSPSFYGYQTLVYSQSVSSSTQLNLTVSDLVLNGRILNSAGQPVANAQLNGYGYSSYGSGSLYATSGSDGRFQVRILQGTYSSLQIIPPSGSTYATTSVPSETFSASVSKDFTLANPTSLSGQVRFSDGTVAAGISVQASSTTSGASQGAYADASGNYVLYLAPDSYNISVQFSSPSFYGYQTLVYSQSVSSSTQLNLTVSDLVFSGRILNSGGQPVANAQLNGYGYSTNGSGSLYATSGSDGRFQVRILQGTYSSLQIVPPSSGGYLQTPVASETFSASVSKEYVIIDADECSYNNGGCSVNATCTNLPGSRTCTCNPGYSGDGLVCELPPAHVIINEILANEPGSSTAGEFVELVNVGGSSIDISGWKVSDATSVRHTFAAGTVLAAGKAVVVFGGASAIPAGLSNAVAASTGTLNLANASDSVIVKDAAGTTIDSFTYSSSLASADGVSMNRSPDTSASGGFVLHNSLSSLAASAGKRANGTAF